jgi:hypothetical protein
MKAITMRHPVKILVLTAALCLPVISWGQNLPDGPGRDKLLTACTVCHGLDNITNSHKKLTAEEWEVYLYDMVARGAPLHKNDIEVVKQYLIKNFAVSQN